MVAYHWFIQVEKVFEDMEITSNTTMIRLAAFQLEGEAQVWWNWEKSSKDLEAMTWAEFHDLFMCKYFLDTTRHVKAHEFLELKQGTMTVMEYVSRFTELDDSYHGRVIRNQQNLFPTSVVNLLQYSGLRSNTGMGFHPTNDLYHGSKW